MNGEPLDVPYGAPLRLRIETQLGYKMVKWIKSIEFVSDYKNIGKGQGGIVKIICIMVMVQVFEINKYIYLVYQKPIKISDKLNKSFTSKKQ